MAGRVALVTGASRGIGAAIAELLGAEGATIVRLARSLQDCSTAAGYDRRCDLTDPNQVEAVAASLPPDLRTPHLVVNNAGAFLLADLADTSLADLDLQLAANLRAPFLVARAFLPGMRAAGRGRHILIGSVADHRAYPGNAAYAASKYGARGLHEVLREEYRGSGVTCTLVSPGPTDTSLWDPIDPDHRPGFPARRDMLRPHDVAEAVLFVATRPPHVDVDWLRLSPA